MSIRALLHVRFGDNLTTTYSFVLVLSSVVTDGDVFISKLPVDKVACAVHNTGYLDSG